MKIYRYISVLFAGLAAWACTDMNEIVPESGTMLSSQLQETNTAIPSRASAAFSGLFNPIGNPNYFGYGTPDDWGILMMLYCNDVESADAHLPDSGYNWFSVCGEYSSRNASYRNPVIRYRTPYMIIANVNDFLAGFPENVEDQNSIYMMAQAKVLRAYAYMQLAANFQFTYEVAKDEPCVPICSPEIADPTNNPRATVAEIYDIIMKDLNEAVVALEGYDRPSKMYIDKQVALGIRARANLTMCNYAEAAADAEAAAEGYTPASREDVSHPTFMDINEPNWIWGFDMTADNAKTFRYATSSSWLRSFSAWAYAAGAGTYTMINKILWDKIPATDIRKQWWVDGELHSTLLDGLTWDGGNQGSASGQDIPEFEYDDKLAFLPYTNVKFGCLTVGTTDNAEDSPLMRVEEMLLIQAEAYAKSGNEAKGKQILENFVKTYRDPSYTVSASGAKLIDEIWFQRRVELWGEGFGIIDTKRLNKPLVRFLGTPESTNIAPAFRFNMAADDGWLNMRFTNGELNTNFGIVDNTGGELPKMDQNPTLRDGVTD